MSGVDFYTRIAPWTRSIINVAPVGIAGGASALALNTDVPQGFTRWILGFSVTFDEAAAPPGQLILQTRTNNVPQAVANRHVISPVVNKSLNDSSDTQLEVFNPTAVAAVGVVWCIIIADTPPNVLADTVIGSLAG